MKNIKPILEKNSKGNTTVNLDRLNSFLKMVIKQKEKINSPLS